MSIISSEICSDMISDSNQFYSCNDSITDNESLNLNLDPSDKFSKDRVEGSHIINHMDFETSLLTTILMNKTKDQQIAPQSLYDIVVSHRWSVESLDYVTLCVSFIISTLQVYCGNVPMEVSVFNKSSNRMFNSLEDLYGLLTNLRRNQWYLNLKLERGDTSCKRCDLKDVVYNRVTQRKPIRKDKFCSVCLMFVSKRNFPQHLMSESHERQQKRLINIAYPFSCSKCDMRYYREQDLQYHISIQHTSSDSGGFIFQPLFCFLCQVEFDNIDSFGKHLTISMEHAYHMEIAMEFASRGYLNADSNCNISVEADVSSMNVNSTGKRERVHNSMIATESPSLSKLTYFCEPCSANVLRSQVTTHEASHFHHQCCSAWVVQEQAEFSSKVDEVTQVMRKCSISCKSSENFVKGERNEISECTKSNDTFCLSMNTEFGDIPKGVKSVLLPRQIEEHIQELAEIYLALEKSTVSITDRNYLCEACMVDGNSTSMLHHVLGETHQQTSKSGCGKQTSGDLKEMAKIVCYFLQLQEMLKNIDPRAANRLQEKILSIQSFGEEVEKFQDISTSLPVRREPFLNTGGVHNFSSEMNIASRVEIRNLQAIERSKGVSFEESAKQITKVGSYFCIPCSVYVPIANGNTHISGKNHRKKVADVEEDVHQGTTNETKKGSTNLVSNSHVKFLSNPDGSLESSSSSTTKKDGCKSVNVPEIVTVSDKDVTNSVSNNKESISYESDNEIEETVKHFYYLDEIRPLDLSGIIYECALCNIRCMWKPMLAHALSKLHIKLSQEKRQPPDILDEKLDLLSNLFRMPECSLNKFSVQHHVLTRAMVKIGDFRKLSEPNLASFQECSEVNKGPEKYFAPSTRMDIIVSHGDITQNNSHNNVCIGTDLKERITNTRAVVIGNSVSTSLKEEFDAVCDGEDISNFELECELCGIEFPIFNEDIELSIDMHVQNDPEHNLATAVPVERNAQSVAEMAKTSTQSKGPKPKKLTKVEVSVKGKNAAVSKLLSLEQKFILANGANFQCMLCNLEFCTDSQLFCHLLCRRHMSEKWFKSLSFADQQNRPSQLWSLLKHKYAISAVYSAIQWIKQNLVKKSSCNSLSQTEPRKQGTSSQLSDGRMPNTNTSPSLNSHKISNQSIAVASANVFNYCQICFKELSGLSKKGKKEHRKKCSAESFCDEPSKDLSSKAKMGSQQLKKDSPGVNKRHMCETCAKDLSSMREMGRLQHKKACSDNNKRHVCETCAKDLSSMAEMGRLQHKKACSDKNKRYVCETCAKDLSSMAEMGRLQHKKDCPGIKKKHMSETCTEDLSTIAEVGRKKCTGRQPKKSCENFFGHWVG